MWGIGYWGYYAVCISAQFRFPHFGRFFCIISAACGPSTIPSLGCAYRLELLIYGCMAKKYKNFPALCFDFFYQHQKVSEVPVRPGVLGYSLPGLSPVLLKSVFCCFSVFFVSLLFSFSLSFCLFLSFFPPFFVSFFLLPLPHGSVYGLEGSWRPCLYAPSWLYVKRSAFPPPPMLASK